MIFSRNKDKVSRAAVLAAAIISAAFAGSAQAASASSLAATSTPIKADGANAPAAPRTAYAPTGKVDEAALLRPGAIKDMSEGDKNAPITIVEYASLTCSHCADFYVNTVPGLRTQYIKTGKVYYILRELTMDPRALAGSMLTRCVPEDKFFPFLQVLFEKQDDWAFVPDAKTPLTRYAKMAGLNDDQFKACLENQKLFESLKKSTEQSVKDFDIRVTPTLFINGNKYEGALSMDQLSPILDKILADKKAAAAKTENK